MAGLQVVSSVVQRPARAAQREAIEQQLGPGPMRELLRVLESPAAVIALGVVSIPLTVGVWVSRWR